MSRIQARFAELAANNKKALIPYITAGDPQPEVTLPLMHALVEAGADLLEVGVPFSDPMADGPVIQAAHERALLPASGSGDSYGFPRAGCEYTGYPDGLSQPDRGLGLRRLCCGGSDGWRRWYSDGGYAAGRGR